MKRSKKGLTSWSHSAFSNWYECPFKAYCVKILRLPEVKGPALLRGQVIHKEAEDFIKGLTPKVSADLKDVEALLKNFRGLFKEERAFVELEFAVDKAWAPVGWFDKNTWARFKLDVVVVNGPCIEVTDWKTGRLNPTTSYDDQMELYNMASLLWCRTAESAKSRMVFTDQKGQVVEGKPLLRSGLAKLQKKWEQRIDCMFSDREFVEKPGQHCRWCSFSAAKKGPCKY